MVEYDGIQVRVETDREIYTVGEPVQFRFFEKNLRSSPIQGGIGTLDVYIYNSKGEYVYGVGSDLDWPANFQIMPNEEITLLNGFSWRQINNKGEQVSPDTYVIILVLDGYTLELEVAILGE